MQKPLDASRFAVFFLPGKTLVAGALLFALTLPMTTCAFRRSVQEHRVELTIDNSGTILCFVWPIVFLLARALSVELRASLWPLIVECVLAVAAWGVLTLQVVIAAVFSLGGIKAAAGYKLAASSLAGYFALALFEGALIILDRHEKTIPETDARSPL